MWFKKDHEFEKGKKKKRLDSIVLLNNLNKIWK